MIVQGSLNYTTSGRRKKRQPKRRKHTNEFRELRSNASNRPEREKEHYPSHISTNCSTTKVRHPEVHGVTVSIPYNKGPYQVIPASDIKYIGK
jgi:hypothetical protein